MSERLPCQVCGQQLVPLADGTSRRHGREGDCPGSGYRLALWPVGQRLRHYAGSVFEVEKIRASQYGGFDYHVRCISDPYNTTARQPGEPDVFHAEYMHRHGWQPIAADEGRRG
jgi:hypothetical protein